MRASILAGSLVSVTSLVASIPASAAALQTYDASHRYTVAELREDFGILRGALEEGHPGLYRYSTHAQINSHFQRLGAMLTEPMTELDFLRVVGMVLAEVNDGHTNVSGTQSFGQYLRNQPIRLPFKLVFLGGRAYVHRNYSDLDDGILGARVVSINGRPMERIVADLFTLLPSDGRVETSKYRRLEGTNAFGGFFSTMYGWSTEFTLQLTLRAGTSRTVTVPGLSADAVTQRFEQRYGDPNAAGPPVELAYRDDIPILTVRTFGSGSYRQAGIDYEQFMQDAFTDFAARGVEDLIIDVRNNGGGSDAYGKILYAYFADSAFDYYAALELNDYTFDFLPYTNAPTREFPENRRRANDRGTYDVLGHPNLGPQEPRTPGYRGRVWILQNGGSFSATGEFTSVLHHNYSNAVFVGEESGAGYYGNVSGSSVRLTLPNTQLRINLPLMKYSSAVEGYTPVDRGLIPNIAIEPTIDDVLAERDVVLESVLARIAESRGR